MGSRNCLLQRAGCRVSRFDSAQTYMATAERGWTMGEPVRITDLPLAAGAPQGMRGYFERHAVPPQAIEHASDVRVWEEEGHLAHVRTGSDGSYEYQCAAPSGDAIEDRTMRHLVLEKGVAPSEARQIYAERWNTAHRAVLQAFVRTLGAEPT